MSECFRFIEALERHASPYYKLKLKEAAEWRRDTPICTVDVQNRFVQENIGNGWKRSVASHGSIDRVGNLLVGEIPTLHRRETLERLKSCGDVVTDVHEYIEPLGKTVNHVHFMTRVPREFRCLVERLLEEP